MSATRERLLAACRVPSAVPVGTWGPWTIVRPTLPGFLAPAIGLPKAEEPVSYTALGRATVATLHEPYGEIVMEDSIRELSRHLPILLPARGRILITGLGLGCVVRGLLAKPEVEHIDVVEIDPIILSVVGPEFEGNARVTLHHGDALTYEWPDGARWDFAWHDVWCEGGSLDLLHGRLLARYRDATPSQGAWQLDRTIKRVWPDRLLNARRIRKEAAYG